MNGILVRLKKLEHPEKFEIRYINRVKTLTITKEGEKKWNYGVTLDGILVLDTNEAKELVNVELMMAKSGWKRLQIEKPLRYKSACRLCLPEIDHSSEWEGLSVSTRFDTHNHCLQILLTDDLESTECYRLTKGCDVLVRESILVGFQLTPYSGNSYLYEMLQ